MILFKNLPQLCQMARQYKRVLDVGGWFRPFNLSTHVIDIEPYETRQTFHALDPEHSERFVVETWYQLDACKDEWPFPDNFFDFSVCSHTLEDLPDPIAVCRQLNRVSKAGYIEVPSKMREIFTKQRLARLRLLAGLPVEIGFEHHHWICDLQGNTITFHPKKLEEIKRYNAFISRGDIGRKMTQDESGLCLWWNDKFDFQKIDISIEKIISYKDEVLHILKK